MAGIDFNLSPEPLPLAAYRCVISAACERQGTLHPDAADWMAPILLALDRHGRGRQSTELRRDKLRFREALTERGKANPGRALRNLVFEVNGGLGRLTTVRQCASVGLPVRLLLMEDDPAACCDAARALTEWIFDPAKAPRMPLGRCTAEVCGCSFLSHIEGFP